MAVIAATDTSLAKAMAILQTVSQEPTEGGKEGCEGEVGDLNLTTSQDSCFLSSGSKDREADMNDCSEYKLRSLDKSRLAELAVLSMRDVEDILGARFPLLNTSQEKTKRSGVVVIDEELCVEVGSWNTNSD